jgi:hypothetical protein
MPKYFILTNLKSCCVSDFFADSVEEILATIMLKDNCNWHSIDKSSGLIYDFDGLIKATKERAKYLTVPLVIVINSESFERITIDFTKDINYNKVLESFKNYNKNI